MSNLASLIEQAAAAGYGKNIKPLDNNAGHQWDYALKYADSEALRYQYVYLSEYLDPKLNKNVFFIRSFAGHLTPAVSSVDLLREAEYGFVSMICLKKMKQTDGTEKEGIYVQTVIPAEYLNGNYTNFLAIVHEIAANADYVEKKFFAGADAN